MHGQCPVLHSVWHCIGISNFDEIRDINKQINAMYVFLLKTPSSSRATVTFEISSMTYMKSISHEFL